MEVPIERSSRSFNLEQSQVLQRFWEGVSYGIYLLEVLEAGTEFRYTAFNPAIARISPIPVEQLMGKTVTEALPREMANRHQQQYCKCVCSGQAISFEENFHQNGQEFWWLLTVKPFPEGNDQSEQLIVTAIDISQHKAIEAELREREQTYRQILDAIGDPVLIKGAQSRILFANKAFCNCYGMSEEELRGLIDAPFNEPDYTQQYVQDDAFVFNTGQVLHIPEEPVTCHDGVVQLWSTVKSPVFNSAGKVIMTVGISHDITEVKRNEVIHKQAEATLIESETKFRRFVENASDLIYEVAADGKFTYLSPQFTSMYGYEVAEFTNQPFAPLVHPEDLPELIRMNQRLFETGEQQFGLELRTRKKDGTWLWIVCNNSPIKDAFGDVIGFHGIARDVSDRKAAEAELEQTKQFLESILDNLPVSVFAKDAEELRFVLWNLAAEKILGLKAEDVLGKNDYDLFPSEQADFFTMKDREVLNNRHMLDIAEEAIRSRSGETRLLHTQKTAIVDADGRPKYLLGITEDITERKTAEVTLQDYAERQLLLNQLANQIRNSLDLTTVIQTAIQSIRDLLEIDHCCFAWYHADASSPRWEVIQEAHLEQISSKLGSYPVSLVGPIDRWLFNQEILRIDHVEQYDEPIHRVFLQQIQCESELLLPIQTHSERVGLIICLTYHQPRPWTDSEVELLRAVGNQLAIAIDQAELYAKTRQKSQELESMLQELKRTQARVVQSEKMSSLGQLIAGIAHEINNPVNFIHGNLSHAEEYTKDLLDLVDLYQHEHPTSSLAISDKINDIDLEFLSEDLPKLLNSMKVGTERIREIVKSLRIFSRLDEAEVKPVNLHEGIDSTLMILHHRIKARTDYPEIQIIKNYGELPEIECYAGQMNQVFMNILVNAMDAIEEMNAHRTYEEIQLTPSQIVISTAVINPQWVQIVISDNGPGIPETIRQRIFDPFFTTKPVGKGTGMGMSISYQIITEKHNGTLNCFSTPETGTEFVIQIPIRQTDFYSPRKPMGRT